MIPKTKFYCKYCNKPYTTIDGALNCPCKKNLKWNSRIGRNSNKKDRFVMFPHTSLTEETKRHRDIIRDSKLKRNKGHTGEKNDN